MRRRRMGGSFDKRVLFTGALVSYTANVLIGTGVATGRIDTSRSRWVHHSLYLATVTLSAAAASSLFFNPSRSGWLILPAAAPLALIPFVSARSPGHVYIALAPAPFIGVAAVRSWSGA